MNLDRIRDLLEKYPLQIAIVLLGGCIGFLVLMRLLRIRMGFPAILFGSLLLILAGSSSMAYLQILSKGVFRWMALAAVAGMALLYLPRSRLALNRLTPVHWGWMAFLVLATVMAPVSGHPTFALLNCVAVSVLFVAAFGTVWFFTSDSRSVISMIDIVHRLAILILVLGVLFVAMPKAAAEKTPGGETTGQGGGRFEGFFNNPNWNGIFSAMVLPIVLWKVRYPASRTEKRISIALAVALALNILASGSRGSIIGAFLACGLAQWRLGRDKLLRYGVLIVPLLALVLLTEMGRGYLESRATTLARMDKAGTLTHRTEMWEQAWPTIQNHLAFGMGLGNSRFILLSGQTQEQEAAQIGGTGATLHSEHIVMLADLGVPGLLWLWAFMAVIGLAGIRMWKSPRSPLSDLGFILFCSCLVVFADSFLHGWMSSAGSPFALLFWILVALCLKSERLGRAEVLARSRGVGGWNTAGTPDSVSAAKERMVH
jgi:O-antigen ligase